MRVKILKTGTFAHPDVSQPQVKLKEGMIAVVDDAMFSALKKAGWAEEIKPEVKAEETKVFGAKKTKKKGKS